VNGIFDHSIIVVRNLLKIIVFPKLLHEMLNVWNKNQPV